MPFGLAWSISTLLYDSLAQMVGAKMLSTNAMRSMMQFQILEILSIQHIVCGVVDHSENGVKMRQFPPNNLRFWARFGCPPKHL